MQILPDQFIDIERERISVRSFVASHAVAGPRPTIVLLHEGLGSIAMWKAFPQQLADITGCRVLAYDRPGHGRSPLRDFGPLDLDYEAFVVLPKLLQVLAITRPILLGHSDGGTIALMAAGRIDPTSVIVEAAHVFMEDAMRGGIARLRAEWGQGKFQRSLARYHGPDVQRMFERWCSTWLSQDFERWAIIDHLHAISAPVLAIQGVKDDFGTPEQLALIARNCGGTVRTVLLPDCGHVPHHERPLQVLDLVQMEIFAASTPLAFPSAIPGMAAGG